MTIKRWMKLSEWIDTWLSCYKLGTIKQTSYHQLELLKMRIPEKLLIRKVRDVTPIELQAFINEFSLSFSKSYIDKMRVMLRSIFTEAKENGICKINPAGRLKVPDVMERIREAYTPAEMGVVLRYADGYYRQVISVAVVALLYTGLRRGELLGLRWDDIDGNLLQIRRSVYTEDYKPVVKEYHAKTRSSLRVVPMTSDVMERINRLPRNGKYIFCVKRGGLMSPRNFSRDYMRFFKALQLEYPGFRILSPHCCRHTCATLALAGGADVRVVQQLLGHSDIKSTARYTHPDYFQLYKAVEGINQTLSLDVRRVSGSIPLASTSTEADEASDDEAPPE